MKQRAKAAERSAGNYDLYLGDIRALARRSRAGSSWPAGSIDALVESHLFYVVRVAREYAFTRIPIEDLLSEGNLGLIEAAARYDPARGTRFITYASWWIRKRILNLLARQMNLIRLPKYKVERLRRLRQAESAATARLGRSPSGEELAAESGLTLAEIESLRLVGHRPVSLEQMIGGEDGQRMEERLGQDEEKAPGAEEEVLDSDMASHLAGLMQSLPENERFVVRHRFGFDSCTAETLEVIAHRMGVSRERVRQIERQALRRIRGSLSKHRAPAPARRVAALGA